jgi:hypothetical protein
MALQKTKTLPNGTSGEYWIAEPITRKRNGTTAVTMLLYKDKATRDAGAAPMVALTIGSLAGAYLGGPAVYQWVKRSILVNQSETNFFADATDV